jgi:hypothetical protein
MSKTVYTSVSRSLFVRLIEKDIPDWLDQNKSLKDLVESPVKKERVLGKQARCLDALARQAQDQFLKLRDDHNWAELVFYTDNTVEVKRTNAQFEDAVYQAREKELSEIRKRLWWANVMSEILGKDDPAHLDKLGGPGDAAR